MLWCSGFSFRKIWIRLQKLFLLLVRILHEDFLFILEENEPKNFQQQKRSTISLTMLLVLCRGEELNSDFMGNDIEFIFPSTLI